MEKERSEKKGQLTVPKMFRRNANAHIPLSVRDPKKRGDGKFLNNNLHVFGGFGSRNHIDNQFLTEVKKRHKLKGWQKQTRRRKKAA